MTALRHSYAERGLDLYESPAVAVEALYEAEHLPKTIWEPACGRCAISKILVEKGHTVFSTDVVDYGSTLQNGLYDFLSDAPPPAKPEAIVTNFPYRHAAVMASRAIALAPKVALLMPISFLEGGTSRSAAGLARMFVLDTHPPARVHIFRGRLPMMHRDGWEGRRATSTRGYAWFVWERPSQGFTVVRRITAVKP